MPTLRLDVSESRLHASAAAELLLQRYIEIGGRMKFLVTLEEDEDGYIVASCPALLGCHSQGRSREEALANIKEAIEGVIASMRKHGEPLPSESDLYEIDVAV